MIECSCYITVMSDTPKLRGFAAMSPERRKELGRQGGKTSQAHGTAHRITSETARDVSALGVAARWGKTAPTSPAASETAE